MDIDIRSLYEKTVAVVGAGIMGHGIAQVFAMAGFHVTLTDASASVLASAPARIQSSVATCQEFGLVTADRASQVPELIELMAEPEAAVAGADFVVEAVFENLDLKRSVLADLERSCPSGCFLTSTTSSLCARDLARDLVRPERFLVTHYWNPPYIVPVVEVVPGERTLEEVVTGAVQILRAAGKLPALVRRDVPGFVGNRLQHALRREAIAIVAQGIASPEDVDLIARFSFGMRLAVTGPLETVDLGGLELTQAIQDSLLPSLDRATECQPLIREKISRGELGAKSGRGFFDWPPGREQETIRRRDHALLELAQWLSEREAVTW